MLTYTAFDSLLYKWKTDNSPRLQSFEPFYLDQWLNNLNFSKRVLQQEIRENLLNLDDKGRLHYLEEMRARLDAVVDTVANLPTLKPTKLRQALQRGVAFSFGDTYKQAIDSLSTQREDTSSPQRDEVAALPFQNEAIQADFAEVYQFITQRLATVKQELLSSASGSKQPSKNKVQPALTWNAGPKDLLDLLLTLQEKNHIIINETDITKLSQAVTSLFQLSHTDGPPESEDWQIFRPYLATTHSERNPDKSRTETYTKRAKKSLYKGVEPFKG
ncbi:hypothetical protein GCM10027422_28680 [Hymenobacter arcticus]